MSIQYEKLEKCYEYYRSVTGFMPKVGLILGSGLGGYAKNMKVGGKEIPYGDYPRIPGFHGAGARRPVYAGLYRRCAGCCHERPGALL